MSTPNKRMKKLPPLKPRANIHTYCGGIDRITMTYTNILAMQTWASRFTPTNTHHLIHRAALHIRKICINKCYICKERYKQAVFTELAASPGDFALHHINQKYYERSLTSD